MPALDISEITDADIDAVAVLWARCGLTRPWNDPAADIGFARSVPNAAVLVGRSEGRIVASVLVGHDGHRGTVYYVSVDPDRQGEGLGGEIMAAAEDWLRGQGVWKLNLMVRAENTGVIEFYGALGYETEERVNMSKWLDPEKRPG
jgi:ribosomal protein S18 acetylase RimI-like enzyme